MAKTSIIVPVYNVEAYLEKCIDSVLAQTESDFELILVDDGSTDSGPGICDVYAGKDKRVRVIHQKNIGLGGARNTGIEAAAGDWLLFIDSDDYIEPQTLETALGAAGKHEADMVVFAYQTVDESGKVTRQFQEEIAKNQPLNVNTHKDMLICAPCAWNKLYKRALFTETGIRYPTRVWYEDIRTTLKLLLYAEKVVYIEDVLYNYLIRAGSITKNINAERNVEILEAFEDFIAYYKEQGKFAQFQDELEYLTIFHVYIAASVRVIKIDRRHALIERFATYLKETFPDYRENKYLYRLGRNKKLVFDLLEKKRYRTIALLFKVKSAL